VSLTPRTEQSTLVKCQRARSLRGDWLRRFRTPAGRGNPDIRSRRSSRSKIGAL